ncbi:hypothetical protein GW819_02050 [Candidatus Gracilibacteria bacterium]|nr:hypothetical protein [Candidatus Gracilibacteria bacterium]OIO77651.1 MAG: hypothetical protein AUJ87_00790 [Candidatus Gracilibacteria bacterium CG1_02_38_174]PIQ11468.1 MAG: hypothetical protein COW68_02630 [Candidatus Gracilibacteria bacterium CG18_big_fil_WC_8_21_14_2_50_38_16]PIQ41867.1 MAG: hypothetical protein COW06_01650 [Candidatus Gracilibacteria bacterium CG12_big_fil_rev_8_21_14_0_65_38_15]PIZ02072.1 MAG: hypothetical protein COY60_00345 [Candidatus Gracilibacteria bacterium CG_4
MFITIVISVIAIYLLDKIVPFSHDIKGIENGNISYYRANTALDEALLSMSGSTPWYETGSSTSLLSNGSGIVYNVTAMGLFLPAPGQGNSEYDADWSVLAPGKPIQLQLNSLNTIDWNNPTLKSHIKFRVPDTNKDGINNESLSGGTTPLIQWSISSSGEILQASGSQIKVSEIDGNFLNISTYLGSTLSGSSDTFINFYINKCGYQTNTTNPICTLKFSLINPLLLNVNTTIVPYLEYRMEFDPVQSVPLQTAVVEGQGYAGGFRKNITKYIQQLTTSEALDFTVFQ